MKKWLWDSFMFWLAVSNKYDKLKENPEKRESSITLGVQSLFLSVVGMIATVGLAFLAYTCFSRAEGSGLAGLLMIVGGVICAIAALVFLFDMVFASLMYAIYQRKLNKKRIGLAALIVSLVLIAATIAGIVIGIVYKTPTNNLPYSNSYTLGELFTRYNWV